MLASFSKPSLFITAPGWGKGHPTECVSPGLLVRSGCLIVERRGQKCKAFSREAGFVKREAVSGPFGFRLAGSSLRVRSFAFVFLAPFAVEGSYLASDVEYVA